MVGSCDPPPPPCAQVLTCTLAKRDLFGKIFRRRFIEIFMRKLLQEVTAEVD